MSVGRGLSSGCRQSEKTLGVGPRWGHIQAWGRPLRRTWQEESGSTWKGGPLECGILEFEGKALGEGM